MKGFTLKSLSASLVLGVASLGFAAQSYAADDNLPVATTVGQILENTQDDQPVQLRGTLTKLEGHDKYSFSDGTGEIQADIDKDELPAGTLTPETRVEIRGEVDKGIIGKTEIDVKSVMIITE